MNISCADNVIYEATVNSLFQEYFDDTCQIFDDIDQLFCTERAKMLTPEYMEMELFEEAGNMPDEKKPYNQGFVAKLGAAIKRLMASIGESFNRFMGHFRKNDKQMQVNTAKLAEAMRKDPSLKNQVLQGVKSGLISTKDLEEINKFNDEYEKLMMEKNPKSLKGKFQKFKKNWDDMDFGKKATAVGAVITTGLAVYTLVPKIRKAMEDTKDFNEKDNKTLSAMLKDIEDAGMDPEKMDAYQIKLAATKYKQGKMSEFYAVLNGNYSKLNSALNAVATHAPGGKKVLSNEKQGILNAGYANSLQEKNRKLVKAKEALEKINAEGKRKNESDADFAKRKGNIETLINTLSSEVDEITNKFKKGGNS